MQQLSIFVHLLEVRSIPTSFQRIFLIYIQGTGSYKVGANYAPGVLPQRKAAAQGYDQNLWLHGPEHYLTEVSFNTSATSLV
jgi:branched-subunit amino acid aminotransferase/4-amino-4-deoxychorismate lyase